MEDFTKKVPTNKHVRASEHPKMRHTPIQHGHEPYSHAEMRKAMDCSNGSQGLGMGKVEHAKMPIYNTFGETVSVVHGHREVGPKI